MTESVQARIPATVFSGFLGSGKTTIIGHLIDDLQGQGVQVAYIKNEVGTDTIDEDIIRGKNITTKELLNGCICCTLVGNFYQALTEIAETIHPDRIIIEASGTSDPIAVALTLKSHPLVQRDGVVTIIDVVNYNGVLEFNKVTQHQAEFTDLIIFNKVELVTDDRKQQVVGYVREVNMTAPIIEAPHGHVHPSLVFGIYTADMGEQTKMLDLKKIEIEQDAALHAEGISHQHSHVEEDQIETFSLNLQAVYDRESLVTALSELPQRVFRIKGYAQMKTESGTQTLLVNGVNKQIQIDTLPEGFQHTGGKLVFIGFLIRALQADVEQALKFAEAK